MRRLLLMSASCLVLGGVEAQAETYEILEGTLTSTETGVTRILTGAFDASPFFGATPGLTSLRVDEFAIQAGDHSFTPNTPIEFLGLTPILFIELADQINLQGDDVGLIQMRSGGELIASSAAEATFRFLDFTSGGGRAIGQLGDGVLPRRLQLEGTLYEVDQTFRIVQGPCILPPIAPTPPDGGVIVIGGGNVIIEHGSFDIHPEETVEFVQPGGSVGVRSRVTGGSSTIEGELQGGGEVVLLNPVALPLGRIGAGATPTLESLGITAPDGAVVSYDDVTGELTVTSEGDLFIDGAAIDLEGLTTVAISTPGNITISGTLSLPPDVVLHLQAGGDLVIEGEIEAPGGVSIPPPDIRPVSCHPGLSAIVPAPKRAVGSFRLVASAARQIDIDVQPRRRRNLVLPGRKQWIKVAILGSDDLDVREIDQTSLRLGRGEAEPTSRRGRRATRRGRANRDRHLDLLARFDVRDTDIAFGDTEVCLVAETSDGETLEGCDAIQTLPRWLRALLRRHSR